MDWNKSIANMINHMSLPSWPGVMIDSLQNLAHFDTCLVATYKKQFKPVVVHTSYELESHKNIRSFVSKAYLLDPLYNAIEQGIASGLYRLRDLAPDSFEKTEQYNSCYSDFDLSDEIIFVTHLNNDVVFSISLGRTSQLGGISRAELNRLKSVQPIIQAMSQQFWQAQSSKYVHNEKSRCSLDHAINTFDSNVLTPREKEITGLVLQGYSSKAIADHLSISVGTIKVHRKSIYLKLNISRESELFSQFINHLRTIS
ncbi:LuxR C-terminal-related transcriptional regulator [uncultured Psychromonas sp.]|jgi:DNA-binding CsgD family transcriptional regulator|uniref:response regulator transcription factor n=1 Tax=uncultured Psychromonas sp. TaxID=173974 RepID=UPI002626CCA8|nr:LuxR C-terminal-related transcriptional regulator [uncultured Psychromonas sp.]